MITVLFPRFDHHAIEERHSARQCENLVRPQGRTFLDYDPAAASAEIARTIEDGLALVVTDPLLLCSPRLAARLVAALGEADAAVAVTNESRHPRQHRPATGAYITVRELEQMTDALERSGAGVEQVEWDDSDPGVFLCRTALLAGAEVPPRHLLRGRRVAIDTGEYVHRWSPMRSQVRLDLLEHIPADARTILELGCGEGGVGAALKTRGDCRVVGVELDPDAAAIAAGRLDEVHAGDARTVVRGLEGPFDWIVASEIVEHVDDPWTFLGELRRLAAPGGHLLLSLPNVANASVIADLLLGRFDYVYMGILCAGHLRFFTRRSIEEMLSFSGWQQLEIRPQVAALTPPAAGLMERMEAAGIPFSREDLLPSGYTVLARNSR